jgi:chromosome segregation ATPase
MSGTSAMVREHKAWCYTKQEDKGDSAVRAVTAVSASVNSAASQTGASVWVWTKEETQTAIANLSEHLKGHLGIEIGKITEPQEADVHVEVRVGERVVAWRVHVLQTEHVASAVKEEPATVEDELKAAKKALEEAVAEKEQLAAQLALANAAKAKVENELNAALSANATLKQETDTAKFYMAMLAKTANFESG